MSLAVLTDDFHLGGNAYVLLRTLAHLKQGIGHLGTATNRAKGTASP